MSWRLTSAVRLQQTLGSGGWRLCGSCCGWCLGKTLVPCNRRIAMSMLIVGCCTSLDRSPSDYMLMLAGCARSHLTDSIMRQRTYIIREIGWWECRLGANIQKHSMNIGCECVCIRRLSHDVKTVLRICWCDNYMFAQARQTSYL